MDINTWRGIATLLAIIAFTAVCWWAFSPKRRKRFKDAADLPFADESETEKRAREQDKPGESTDDDDADDSR